MSGPQRIDLHMWISRSHAMTSQRLRMLALCCALVIAVIPTPTSANWMYLGVASLGATTSSSSTGPGQHCNMLPGLVYQQLRLCQENPQAIPCVSLGARIGISECQSQFRYERWNCTTNDKTPALFGNVLDKGTKEAAFIFAVTSAGVVHAVTMACSAGNLTDCSCDMTRQGMTSPEGWKWGGCSDNVDYGTWFARTFVDAPEKLKHATSKDVRALMNLHNNEVGRQSIINGMSLKCRCHGVSGSCAVKTCWKMLPSFWRVGKELKRKYETSVQIAPRSKRKLRRRDKRTRRTPITELDLVYVDHSPNYCRQDLQRDILGTRGRECKVNDPHGSTSCDLLCCGRGYNTELIRHVERCHCKFIWCCEVKCQSCETIVQRHTCK